MTQPVPDRVTVVDATGRGFTVPADQALAAQEQGYQIETPEQTAQRRYSQQAGLGEELAAGAQGIASGLTVGGSDYLAGQLLSPEAKAAMLRREAEFGGAYIGGNIVGGLVPALLSGGSSAGASVGGRAALTTARAAAAPSTLVTGLATRAGAAAGRAVAGEAAEQGIARGIAATAARLGAEGAVEGGLQAAGSAIGHASLADEDLTLQQILAVGGEGALLGGLPMAGLGAAGKAGAIAGGVAGRGVAKVAKAVLPDSIPGYVQRVADAQTIKGYTGATGADMRTLLTSAGRDPATRRAELATRLRAEFGTDADITSLERKAVAIGEKLDEASGRLGAIVDEASAAGAVVDPTEALAAVERRLARLDNGVQADRDIAESIRRGYLNTLQDAATPKPTKEMAAAGRAAQSLDKQVAATAKRLEDLKAQAQVVTEQGAAAQSALVRKAQDALDVQRKAAEAARKELERKAAKLSDEAAASAKRLEELEASAGDGKLSTRQRNTIRMAKAKADLQQRAATRALEEAGGVTAVDRQVAAAERRLAKLQEAAEKPGEITPAHRKTIERVAAELDAKRAAATQARATLDQMRPEIAPPPTLKDMLALRRRIDKEVNWRDPAATAKNEALTDVRRALQEQIDAAIGKASPDVQARYRQANRDYGDWADIDKIVTKRTAMEDGNRGLSLTDTVMAAGGIASGNALAGAAGAIGNKIIRSSGASAWVGRKLAGIADARSLQEAGRASRRAMALRVATAVGSRLGKGAKVAAPRAVVQYDRLQAQAEELQRDREAYVAALSERAGVLDGVGTASATYVRTQLRATQYLAQELPRPIDTGTPTLGVRRTPPASAMAAWQRKARAVSEPMTVVDDLRDGSLTSDAVEALGVTHPQLLEAIRTEVAAELGKQVEAGKVPSSQALGQISILLGRPVDATQDPVFIAAQQASFPVVADDPTKDPTQNQQDAIAPRVLAGGAESLDSSARAALPAESALI